MTVLLAGTSRTGRVVHQEKEMTMRKMMLAAAALLSLSAGSSHAAANRQNGYALKNDGAAIGTTVTAATAPQTAGTIYGGSVPAATAPHMAGTLYVGSVPNPWNGTESWRQFNLDHPSSGDGD
jgi:hypothetical protein